MDTIEEEFDSTDDEPESDRNSRRSPVNAIDIPSHKIVSVPNNDMPAESDNGDINAFSLKISNETRTDDDFISLKVIPGEVKDNMGGTFVCGQENVDKTTSLGSTKIEYENSKKEDCLVQNEDDVSQGEKDTEDEFGLDRESITHQQLMDLTSKSIASLIESDPLLSDLPSDVTLEEINSQIALVQGQSISVMIAASQPAKLVVAQDGTVLDLKRSLQRHTALRLARQGRSKVKVNWRYFWRTHWLVQPGGNRLTRDSDKLKDLGIVNKSVLTYCKRLHERQR